MTRPWFATFRARLTLRWTLAVGVILAVANLTIYGAARRYVDQWLDGNVRTLAATEAASTTDGFDGVHLHERVLGEFEPEGLTEKLVQIFDGEGTLLLQSSGRGELPPVVSADVVRAALAGQASVVATRAAGRPLRVAVVRATGTVPVAVAVGFFTDDIDAGLRSLALLLAGVWVVGLGVTAAIGYRLASRALTPVAGITERAAWIARGHFDARLEVPSAHDELGRMAVLLNSMLDRLHAAVEANRRFAADASHELRGPLTAIAGEVDVLLRHPRDADDYRQALVHVRGRVAALTRLAGDLILLARVQEGTRDIVRREVALDRLVIDVFQRCQAEATGRGMHLQHTGLAGVRVYADPALLARVMDNVVGNAIRYGRDGGEVVVTASVELPPEDGSWTAPVVRILIRDSGPGIPADDHDRVFERFYRVDRSRTRQTGGSGLGLAICREVLAVHGGTIRVATSSSAGTTFEITLAGQRATDA